MDIIKVLLKRIVDRPSINVRILVDEHIPKANHVLPGVSILLIDQFMLLKEGWQISGSLEATEVFVNDQVPCHVVERLNGEMEVSLNRTVNFDVRCKLFERVRLCVLQVFDKFIQLL